MQPSTTQNAATCSGDGLEAYPRSRRAGVPGRGGARGTMAGCRGQTLREVFLPVWRRAYKAICHGFRSPTTPTPPAYCIISSCMRSCPKCERSLEERDFPRRGRLCKQCARMPSIRRRAAIAFWLEEMRETLKCLNCGFDDPRALHFHHIDGSTKEASISRLVHSGASVARIRREMAKCVVLCANCHAIEHADEWFDPDRSPLL